MDDSMFDELIHNRKWIFLFVTPCDQIKSFKEKIRRKEDVPVADQKLFLHPSDEKEV